MKLVRYEKELLPNAVMRIKAEHRDQMRTPIEVSIKLVTGELAQTGGVTLVEGDGVEVTSMMFGFADIAWEMGWRPRGLLASLPQYVQGYKLPPVAR